MVKNIIIDDTDYKVTNEEAISTTEELIFEIKSDKGRNTYVKAMWNDMLGHQIEKIWKILN
jgi:hypothetical protein